MVHFVQYMKISRDNRYTIIDYVQNKIIGYEANFSQGKYSKRFESLDTLQSICSANAMEHVHYDFVYLFLITLL